MNTMSETRTDLTMPKQTRKDAGSATMPRNRITIPAESGRHAIETPKTGTFKGVLANASNTLARC